MNVLMFYNSVFHRIIITANMVGDFMCSDKYYVHMDLVQPISNSQLQLLLVCYTWVLGCINACP